MKSFDTVSIQARLLEYLKRYIDPSSESKVWNKILNDSAIQSLLYAIAEDSAESARYFEYLLKEAKWDMMKNPSSAWNQAAYLGYNPHRKISSIGTVVFSHDATLEGAGVDFFESQLEELTAYSGANISIPVGTRLSSGSYEFITSETLTYANGIKYLEVPIIQGVRSYITTITGAEGIEFETVKFVREDIEAALDDVSQQFLTVTVYLGGNINNPQTATILEDIYLASPTELACDIHTAKDYSYISVRFGDGLTGIKLPQGSIVRLDYLQTAGSSGNISESFEINTILSDNLSPLLYCTNFSPTLGGDDNETMESIRENAPSYYLIADRSIVTSEAYVQNIEAIPGIHKASVSEGTYVDEISAIEFPAILFTAITTEGEAAPASTYNSLLTRTNNRRPPLDVIVQEDPDLIALYLGVQATVTGTQDLAGVETGIQTLLEKEYDILEQSFTNSFDGSEDVSTIWGYGADNNVSIARVSETVEGVIDLKPSTFVESTVSSYFEKTFSFSPVFTEMKKFEDGKVYCIKVQIRFYCEACEDSQRTLFLIANEEYPSPGHPEVLPYRMVQYPYIEEITTKSFMENVVLTPGVGYEEIEPADDDYINFTLTVDYTDDLNSGKLIVPLYKKDGTSLYINFNTADEEELDDIVSIKVYAEPMETAFTATEYNEMIYADEVVVEIS